MPAVGEKNLVILRGAQGYVMCGYLDKAIADTLGEVALKISGIDSIDLASEGSIWFNFCGLSQRVLKQQPIRDVF